MTWLPDSAKSFPEKKTAVSSVHATLKLTLSDVRSVRWPVTLLKYYPKGVTAPAHPHATDAVEFTALLLISRENK